MSAPTLQASMERRILVNYRVDPEVLGGILPAPFRPALVGGFGLAGICVIRLTAVRPAGLPRAVGMTVESAAHRIAVRWDAGEGDVSGVYIPRRDTSSRLATLAGGRVFPGRQHLADIRVTEGAGAYRLGIDSRDGTVHVEVSAHVADHVPPGSVFADVAEMSRFLGCAPIGCSTTSSSGVFDVMDLEVGRPELVPLWIDEVSSSFFEGPDRFPPGSTTLDSAFLMRDLATTWRPRPRLVATGEVRTPATTAGSARPSRIG